MYRKKRKAFTMIELVFVITIIGVLAAIAIPKFAMNRDDAVIVKAKSTVAAIRNSVATERQKRILRGVFTPIFKLSSSNAFGSLIFDGVDGNTAIPVLAYPPLACANGASTGCWRETTTGTAANPISAYTYYMPVVGSVVFTLNNNQFNCSATTGTAAQQRDCRLLTQ